MTGTQEILLTDIEDLANCIRQSRISQGISQQQLADFSGMHRNGIAKIESGRVDAQLSSILNLCRLLNIDLKIVVKDAP